jgi:hypothetical protein
LSEARDIAGTEQRQGGLDFLLSGPGVLVFWLCYGLIHAILRLNISRTLAIDDARATELTQNLALGYQARQPPLYEWLLWSSQQVFGTGIESDLFVRYLLIAGIGVSCFGAARAAIKDGRWAAVASLSLAFSYPVGWTFHEWATQTILLCIGCFATLHATLNWIEAPSPRAAFWLGAAIGFGLLSKFSFPLFLCGLLIACLTLPEARRKLTDRRLFISAVIALLMLLPYIVWLWQVHGNVAHAIAHTMIPQPKPYLSRVTTGLAHLAKSIPLFLLPWIAFVALFAPSAFGFAKGAPPPRLAERLVLRTMLAAALLAAIGIVAIGATNIAERYMHPILIVAPVYAFARVARYYTKRAPVRPFVQLALGVALVIAVVRVIAVADNGFTRRADRLSQIPFRELAERLAKEGIARGTVLTFDVRESGNLRAFLPELRVIGRDSFRVERPPKTAGSGDSCVLIYRSGQEDAQAIAGLATERLEISGAPSRLGAPRRETWFMARLDPRSAACE